MIDERKNEVLNKLSARLNRVKAEYIKIRQMLEDVKNGKEINILELDDSIADNSYWIVEGRPYFVTIMQTTLMMTYETDNVMFEDLRCERYTAGQSLSGSTGVDYRSDIGYITPMLYFEDHMQDMYEEAVAGYKTFAKQSNGSLINGLSYIPEKCPWTAYELAYTALHREYYLSIPYLPVPDFDTNDVYLQNFNYEKFCCKASPIVGKTCSECPAHRRKECIKEFKDVYQDAADIRIGYLVKRNKIIENYRKVKSNETQSN